ncbi:hypothetical protein NE237_006247 [Protea cynaroides]|uniref:Cathepsin propeptide inhibitor domain-containing protein n=1 Tax=Protea cynaroides TaxID=273540 RepID=A0A9Q0KLY7_9MAGN|nr:hypothetical protein NE237_006247 [Protea cynaroides]
MEMGKVIVAAAVVLSMVRVLRLPPSLEFNKNNMVFNKKSLEFNEKDMEMDYNIRNLYERWSSHHNISCHHPVKEMHINVFKENAKYIHEFNKKMPPTSWSSICLLT